MRIVLIGQAAFGAKTLEVLVERGDQVVAVYTPPDGPGGRIDALKEAALAAEIPVFQPASYNDDGAFAQYRDLAPDLTVLAFVTDIIPERYLDLPTAGTICYHPSQLPRHRGASAINWAVIMGDTRTGLTVFWADGGIDTGPILLQKQIDIGPEDTTGSLYFNQLFPMGIEAIAESVDLVKQGKAPSIVQDEGAPPTNHPATTPWRPWTSADRRRRSTTWCGAATPNPGRMRPGVRSGCVSTGRSTSTGRWTRRRARW